MNDLKLTMIARARNGFTDKFGIPRQPRTASCIETRIVFEPAFRVRESLRGIEGFSHLWLLWGFSANRNTGESWSPTVRPPRLGGNTRMGVFATRSPYRPNPVGLSSVRLLRIEESREEGLVLVVAGADLLDGTPIYDIKPYLSFSDAHPDARDGFAGATKDYCLRVEWDKGISLPEDAQRALQEILEQDPRPAYQDDPDREYKLDYARRRITFRVSGDVLHVLRVQEI